MRLQDRPRWQATASRRLRRLRRRGRGHARDRAVRSAPRELPAARPGRGVPQRRDVGDGGGLLVLAFESADHPVDPWLDRALEIAARPRRRAARRAVTRRAGEPARTTRRRPGASSFLRMPYLRDEAARHGMVVETFETACTWDRFEAAHAAITTAAAGGDGARLRRRGGDLPLHPRLPGRAGALLRDLRAGSVGQHGRPVGRDQGGGLRGDRRARAARSPTTMRSGATTGGGTTGSGPTSSPTALAAAQRRLDPAGILNPGVLLPSRA